MAIEDAAAIARSLFGHAGVTDAFAAYEHARRRRVESIADAARRNDDGKAGAGPVAAWFRDRLMGLFLPRAGAFQTRMYAHREDLAWLSRIDPSTKREVSQRVTLNADDAREATRKR